VTIAVIVLSAVVTASLSLVLEDVLPKTDPGDVLVASRWVLFASSALLVGLAVWLRYEVRSYSGTLFSVQVLDEGVADRPYEGGMESRLAATRRYLYIRSVHRWMDYDTSIRHGVIDVHELCHEIGVTLESLMNADSDEGVQTVAPNMPWPMAMAVGTYLPVRNVDIRLLELPKKDGEGEHEFSLRYVQELSTGPTARKSHSPPGVQGDRVGALITLTEGEVDLDCFQDLNVGTVYSVPLSADFHEQPSRYLEPELESCGRRMAEELTLIKKEHPDRELVVAAEVPAAIAMSAGWHLTQYPSPFYRGAYLLYRDGNRSVPMRVRPSQPARVS
jgi:hypothetical protein